MTDAKRDYTVVRTPNDDDTVTYALTIPASCDAALLDAAIDAGLPFDEFIYKAIGRRITPSDTEPPDPNTQRKH